MVLHSKFILFLGFPKQRRSTHCQDDTPPYGFAHKFAGSPPPVSLSVHIQRTMLIYLPLPFFSPVLGALLQIMFIPLSEMFLSIKHLYPKLYLPMKSYHPEDHFTREQRRRKKGGKYFIIPSILHSD